MSLQKALKEKFNYSKGFFRYKTGVNEGKVAGWRDKDGYSLLYVDGKTYRQNRLVWVWFKGDTELEIDHINGDLEDNRIENLREATRTENNQNRKMHSDNKSGYKGVNETAGGKFTAYIKIDGVTKNLGTFDKAEDAGKAYREAAKDAHGDFHTER